MTVPGKAGRPRKPSNLRALDGDKPDRFNHAEPLPSQGAIQPPGWLVSQAQDLGPDGESALDVWRRYAPDLIAKGVLTAWDVEAFATWCISTVGYRKASAQVVEHGLLVRGSMGNLVKNPACQLQRDYSDTMMKVGARFGMSPSDRAGIKVDREPQRGGAERLLS